MSSIPEISMRSAVRSNWLSATGLHDLLWLAAVAGGAAYALAVYYARMDAYETGILILVATAIAALGRHWRALRALAFSVAALSLLTITLYGDSLDRAAGNFLLNYFLASQPAIMWMSTLFVLAALGYYAALLSASDFAGRAARALTWTAVAFGLTGMLVRWRESYLISPDIGHIPISNLYEVFVLFCLITALVYLYYETRFSTRALGAFALTLITAAVAFLTWYSMTRGAHEIQPLVPALRSYWMKLHVPANFIGYGCFSLAAMTGIAYLVRQRAAARRPGGRLAAVLPKPDIIDELMYRLITLGFAFFTLATILGSLWAAEAWGGYWSWDPKETWALIVWLNYAAWLHMRMSLCRRGAAMAWWAVIGLLITLFAFLGVNLFLSGLHSYGEL
jgi:cytochrome c-type biogenesis protein CcsB